MQKLLKLAEEFGIKIIAPPAAPQDQTRLDDITKEKTR
jgi:hypothetical protein